MLNGCATTSEVVTVQKHDNGNATTFKTRLSNAGIDLSDSDFIGGGKQVSFQVRARCEEPDCTPSEALLSFFLDSGSSTVYLADRSLTIQAGGEQYDWERKKWLDIRNTPPVLGKIVAVTLDMEALENIAEAETVTGRLALQPFDWSYELREPLRMLLSRMKGQATDLQE